MQPSNAFGESCEPDLGSAHELCKAFRPTQQQLQRFIVEVMQPLCRALGRQLPGQGDFFAYGQSHESRTRITLAFWVMGIPGPEPSHNSSRPPSLDVSIS